MESSPHYKNKDEAQALMNRGERVSHLWPDDCYYAHLSLYHFALPFVQGKTVLDAGSGGGYGAAYLAEHGASSVIAVDVDPDDDSYIRPFIEPKVETFHTHLVRLFHRAIDVYRQQGPLVFWTRALTFIFRKNTGA
jgi:predicted nicotinamide N-methyase